MQRSDSLMSQAEEKQQLEIFVSCRKLSDLGPLSMTDSYLVVKLIQANMPEKVILKSKVYWNSINPNYAESVLVDFFFQIKQKLVFQIYHYEAPPKLIGRYESSLGEIFGSPEHGLIRDLKSGSQTTGKIIVRCEKEQKNRKQIATLKLSARGLPNITWWYFFGGTNAFFRIFRKRQNDELLVYQSERVASVNPSWFQFRMSERRLVSNDPNKELEVRIYHYNNNGNHEVIGSAIFKMGNFKDGATFDILNKSKNRVGTLVMDKYTSRAQYQLGDFVQNGLQLALVTCIDFTASNGVMADKKSLHYISQMARSPYQKALEHVTSILLDYDYDKLVPVYGFGAKVKHPKLSTYNQVHHCFPINCDQKNPNLYKTEEIMRQYRKILPYLQFSGPTKFAQLLKVAINQCQEFKKLGTHYMILFILTDGQIHDQKQVIDLIVKCNELPMSVIIVGIGSGEFGLMHQLDDDNCEMIDSKGNKTTRDLVQFVEFQKFSNNGAALAKEVLEELPRQVSEYFQLVNVSPEDVKSRYGSDDIGRVIKLKEQMKNPYEY